MTTAVDPTDVLPDDLLAPIQERFRTVMANVASPVSVVTTADSSGVHGTTVSAFMSLSMNPPLIAVALDNSSTLLSHLAVGRSFGVNVLDAQQHGLAARFARKGRHKFLDVAWRFSAGQPRLDAAHGWLACSVDRLVDGGDHTLVVGLVTEAEAAFGSPLTYYHRTFGTHQPH